MKRKAAQRNSLGCVLILVIATMIGSVRPARSANREATVPGTAEGLNETTPRDLDTPATGVQRSLSIGCVGVLAADASVSVDVLGDQDGAVPNEAGNTLHGDGGSASHCAECGAGHQDRGGAALRNNFFALIAEIVD